jgi:hypothetical protein
MARSFSPLANRICVAVSIFTFASWTVLAAALFAWAPAREALGQRVASAAARIFPGRLHSALLLAGDAPKAVSAPRLEKLESLLLSEGDQPVELVLAPKIVASPEVDLVPEVVGCPSVSASSGCTSPSSSDVSASDAASAVDYSYGYTDEDSEFAWTVTGDGDDVIVGTPYARRVRAHAGDAPAFWFRDGGESYVVRDPALVKEARRVCEPLRAVGREMGQVGGEMGKHGAAMGRIGGKMGALGARLARLELRIASRESAESAAAMREHTKELRAELSRLQEQLSDQQAEHAVRQRELSRRMSVLSAKHERVLKDVRQQMRELARRAQREGKAERPHANA